MALYIPHSIFHLARLLYVRPETFGPYYVYVYAHVYVYIYIYTFFVIQMLKRLFENLKLLRII